MTMLKSFATVGGATILSRILGFLRDTMIAAALGTGPVADAFVVAFRLPNLFRRLFAEGVFNSAFVPLYSRELEEHGEEGARRLAAEVASMLIVTVTALCAVAMVAAPWLVDILAFGFARSGDKFDLTVLLTRICLPYLGFMSVTGLLGSVMAAHRRFLLPALAPVVLNIVLIGVLVLVHWAGLARSPEGGQMLAYGVSLAGIAQLALVAMGVARSGAGFPLQLPRLTASIRRLAGLALPGFLAGGITQINIVVGTTLASAQAGAVAYLYYADRVYQLPLGVVGIAIGVVLLPEIAYRIRSGRDDLAYEAQNRSLEFALALTVPASFGLMVAAHPIVEVLFERGAFGPRDTSMTADALAAFAFGLPAFVMVKVFSPAFFARLDMKTPTWIAVIAMLVNVVAGLLLFWRIGHLGIALATSLAGWINAALLFLMLVRRRHWRTDGSLEHRLPRLLAASAVMALFTWLAERLAAHWLGAENGLMIKVSALALVVAGSMAVFVGVGLWLGGFDWRALRSGLAGDPGRAKLPVVDVSID